MTQSYFQIFFKIKRIILHLEGSVTLQENTSALEINSQRVQRQLRRFGAFIILKAVVSSCPLSCCEIRNTATAVIIFVGSA